MLLRQRVIFILYVTMHYYNVSWHRFLYALAQKRCLHLAMLTVSRGRGRATSQHTLVGPAFTPATALDSQAAEQCCFSRRHDVAWPGANHRSSAVLPSALAASQLKLGHLIQLQVAIKVFDAVSASFQQVLLQSPCWPAIQPLNWHIKTTRCGQFCSQIGWLCPVDIHRSDKQRPVLSCKKFTVIQSRPDPVFRASPRTPVLAPRRPVSEAAYQGRKQKLTSKLAFKRTYVVTLQVFHFSAWKAAISSTLSGENSFFLCKEGLRYLGD